MHRFQQMEVIVHQQGKNMTDLSLQELDAIWNEVKKK
jgi:hypothetical protein